MGMAALAHEKIDHFPDMEEPDKYALGCIAVILVLLESILQPVDPPAPKYWKSWMNMHV